MVEPSDQLVQKTLQEYLASLAAGTSTPGGGTAAAITGAQGCALLSMVCEFTRNDERIVELAQQCTSVTNSFIQLADQDIEAFEEVMNQYRLDRSGEAYQSALHRAAEVPMLVIQEAASLVDTAEYLETAGNRHLISDVAIGANLLATAMHSATVNVYINCQLISNMDFTSQTIVKMRQHLLIADRLSAVFNRISQNLGEIPNVT